jgi:hypothetical protein
MGVDVSTYRSRWDVGPMVVLALMLRTVGT